MKKIACILCFTVQGMAAIAQTGAKEGPAFDAEGHYTTYTYADGTRDIYMYDSGWRMVKFLGRDGKETSYVYTGDGKMQTVSH